VNFNFHFNRPFVFRLTGCLRTLTDHFFSRLTKCLRISILADTIYTPYLRIMPGHCTNIGEKDTLFKDREPPKTIPYSAARTYIAYNNPSYF